MPADTTQFTQCYTWNGHGNLGDDWIGEVRSQYFDDVIEVREKRSLNPMKFGRHQLARDDGETVTGQLVLWGGGWVAADRPGSRTMSAWARHLSSGQRDAIGVGLGIGPFTHGTPQQMEETKTFLDALRGRLAVRTLADLHHLPAGQKAILGCDAALLDKRFWSEPEYSGAESPYVVFSFPAYSAHWMSSRVWMSEAWYLRQVGSLAEKISRTHQIVFVEFDQMVGSTSDSDYWRHLPGVVVSRPGSIEEAADVFRQAWQIYAGRLHAAILGGVVGSPTLAVAYHHKFEVVREIGIPTIGLAEQPGDSPQPDFADRGALEQVRRRGLDALAAVRW